MIATPPAPGAQTQLAAKRAARSAFVALGSTLALAGCFSDLLVLDPSEAVAVPFDSPVAARISLTSSYSRITVLGSWETFHTYVRDGSGAVLCAAHYLGCAPELFTKRIEWKTDRPGVVAFKNDDGVVLNGSAYVTALTPGRVQLTASVDGVEATAVVEIVERARAAWSVPGMTATQGIAVGEDGTLYATGARGLQAVGLEGEVRWAVPAKVRSMPAIADDGTIYLGASEGLFAISPDGRVLWVTPLPGPGAVWSPPAIGPDGTIYQNTNRGTLHAVDPSGRVKWRFEAPGPLFRNPSPPAIALDGTIYFPSEDNNLYALDPDGRERWRFATQGPVRAVSIGLDGTLYFANDLLFSGSGRDIARSGSSRLYALNPDGTERWSAPLEGEVWAGPAIGFDGTLYMGTYNQGGATFVFSPDGSLLRKVAAEAIHTPIVAGDGSIYYSGGAVAAFDRDGTQKWRFQPENFASPAPAIGFDGKIYAGASDDAHVETIYAFEEMAGNNGGYRSAPWPQARGDRANTGRARRGP
jgi:outer membrane protein assembly factor BamB